MNAAAQNAGNYQGSELDLILTWNAKKYLQIQGGYAHFFAGNYLTGHGRARRRQFRLHPGHFEVLSHLCG